MRLHPSTRGWALACTGALATASAVALGSTDLLRVGVLLLLLVAAAAVAATLEHRAAHRHLHVHRTVDPQPLSVGESARVSVHISPRAGHRTPLGGLRLRERAAVELSGGRALRATVTRDATELTLGYQVHATARGRWSLGPVTATVGDPFGIFSRSQPLGGAADVAVWPRVVELEVPRGGLTSDPETSALGARTPSADDASLRAYRPGDDLRRVHWPSSAKRGTTLVRTDEHSAKRPVTVLLDLPCDDDGTEWSISLAASITLAMLRAGHPVRFLTTDSADRTDGTLAAQQHAHPPLTDDVRATVLDATIDLTPASGTDQAEQRLLAAVQVLAAHVSAETVIAVVGPLSDPAKTALASAVGPGHGWAIVRKGTPGTPAGAGARLTSVALGRAGWLASEAAVGDDLAATWNALVGEQS